MKRALLALALVVLGVGGCSSGGGSDPASAPSPPVTTTTAPAPVQSASPTAEPSAGQVSLGTPRDVSGDAQVTVVATAYAYRPVSSVGTEQPGFGWGAADVKVCLSANHGQSQVMFGQNVWRLVFPDDTQSEPSSSTYDDFPKPEYPVEQAVAVGRCIRGWITFPVKDGARPNAIEYGPSGTTGVQWHVS